jgi:catechol 2,3-dioxygenase-like lactoylglutathione lyase family enzyme
MFARIAHVAIYTESYEKMANFYKTIFGMKQITEGMRDA